MSPRVLVVEDNRALAENVAEMLTDEGVAVQTCADAESAERLAAAQSYDLAIVDIGLAGNDSGLELVPRLRRHSAQGEILLMTGNATLNSAILAIRRGVYAYIPKPFDPDQLITLVKNALAQVALKQEKQALTQRLSASELLYRGVVDTVEACILGLDREGVIRFGNRFAVERLALTQVELSGRAFASLCDQPFERDLQRAIARAVAGEAVREHECTHTRLGRTRTVRWTLTPLSTISLEAAQLARDVPLDQSPVVLAVGIDITDRIELERKSAEAEAMAAMGTLTTSLAHEIRNPLNAAKLQLELLIRRSRRAPDPKVQQQLVEPAELVRSELDRLSVLLDDFLNLARPRLLLRQPCSVAELFDVVIKLKEPLAQSSGIRLSVQLPDPALTMRADADKLKQVLINLVGNAIDALSERGQGGHVELGAEPNADGGVTISVKDDGPGMSPEVAATAFRPFVTSKAGGTGLGLAIVQKIVSQHGGEADLLPREGGGTIARFTISA